jgi:hypothetical protein
MVLALAVHGAPSRAGPGHPSLVMMNSGVISKLL